MYQYRTILNRVGIVLVAVGILDIVYTLYGVLRAQDRIDSLGLNILTVVAGVFLLRGSLAAVPILTWGIAFMIANFVSVFILLPFVKPAELWAIEFRLDPISLSISLLIRIATIALLVWVYTQLRAAPVVSAIVQSGRSVLNLTLAFILGIAIAVLPVGIIHVARGSADGAKAVAIARTQYGEDYKYYVTAMRWSTGDVQASLTAYNEQEIKPVQVEWKR